MIQFGIRPPVTFLFFEINTSYTYLWIVVKSVSNNMVKSSIGLCQKTTVNFFNDVYLLLIIMKRFLQHSVM